MAPRRSYRKSTRGCTTCKSRKVKCDEVHPECGNCRRRGNSCSYVASLPNPSFKSIASSSSSSESNELIRRDPIPQLQQPEIPRYPPGDSNEIRLFEMRLIAHVTSITYTTVSGLADDEEKHVWSHDITELAFQNDPENPLMDILLGLSARHLQLLNPDDSRVASRSLYYHNRGLEKCNKMLLEISEESCVVVFASSVLIALHLILQRHDRRIDEYQVPIAWFQAMRGVYTVGVVCRPWIKRTKLKSLIHDWQPATFDHEIDDDSPFKSLLAGLETHPSPEHVRTYTFVVKYLNWVYIRKRLCKMPNTPILRKALGSFPGIVPSLFLTLMEQNDPRTLAILAHFFGLLQWVHKIWWLEGLPERELRGLITIVPADWMWAMEWPMQQLAAESKMALEA